MHILRMRVQFLGPKRVLWPWYRHASIMALVYAWVKLGLKYKLSSGSWVARSLCIGQPFVRASFAFWQIVADQYFGRFVIWQIVCLKLSQSVSVCLRMVQSVSVCLSLSRSVSVCLSLSQSISVCPSLSQSISVYLGLSQSVSVCFGLSQSAPVCLSLS